MSKRSVMEFFEAAAGAAMIAGLVALYCWATPAQSSAEADWFSYQCEEAGK